MRASSPYLKTEPAPGQIRYDLAVSVPLRVRKTYRTHPWLRVTADNVTGAIECAAGIRVERLTEEDGA